MKDTLFYIIVSIVDNPDEVAISEQDDDGFITFTVSVAKEDMGKVIGKEGKVIKAIINVLKIPAIKQNKRLHITMAEK